MEPQACGVSGALYTLIGILTGLHPIYSCTYRSKMRAQFGLPEDVFTDFCIHIWCEPCALSQEYLELQRRGYNLTLGWHGNMHMERTNGMMPPSVPGGMTR